MKKVVLLLALAALILPVMATAAQRNVVVEIISRDT